jgi:transposase InsO family protein
MRDDYRGVGLTRLCRLLGITRQSWYQHGWREEVLGIEGGLVVDEVARIRQSHRRMGGRKLYELLEPFMLEHGIKMGRDALFDLLSANGLLVRKMRRRVCTTNSFHWLRKYPNIIRGFIPSAPDQLWVADITYWKIGTGYVYISFITDAYSRKVVGYHVARTLEALETKAALEMALSGLDGPPEGLVHHSDRGIQYCSSGYVKLLQEHGIGISMTENGDPLENAIAERLNGIIKHEYLTGTEVKDIQGAKRLLGKAVRLYNEERPHASIGYLTPENVHANKLKTERLWKSYYGNNRILVNPLQDCAETCKHIVGSI